MDIQLRSGNTMPAIGLGTWQLAGEDATNSVYNGLELGYRMIDTSSDYGNLTDIRRALKMTSVPRSEIFMETKVEETDDSYDASRSYVNELGLGYADLIIIHRPPAAGAGQDLWQGLRRARDQGVTRDIGVSSYSMDQLQALYDDSGEWPAVNQIEWTPFGYSSEMHKFCKKRGIVLQAYSPLAHSGKIRDEVIVRLAEMYGKSPSQIVLRWNIQHGVVPLPKSSSSEHLAENIDIFDFEIAPEDMRSMDQLNQHYSALGAGSLSYI